MASMMIIGIIDSAIAGITRNIIGTPALAWARSGKIANVNNIDILFLFNLATVPSLALNVVLLGKPKRSVGLFLAALC